MPGHHPSDWLHYRDHELAPLGDHALAPIKRSQSGSNVAVNDKSAPRTSTKAEEIGCKDVQSRPDAKSARILTNPQQPLATPANGRKKNPTQKSWGFANGGNQEYEGSC